jgi:spore coat protein H
MKPLLALALLLAACGGSGSADPEAPPPPPQAPDDGPGVPQPPPPPPPPDPWTAPVPAQPAWPPLQDAIEHVELQFAAQYASTLLSPLNDAYLPGRMFLDGRWWDVTLRQRGDGARDHPKHSWKTRLPKGTLAGGRRTRNFLAEYLDSGYLSDPFSYTLMNAAGVPTAHARFVTLRVNGTFEGVYVELEEIDKRFLDAHGCFDPDATVYRCGTRDCELKTAPLAHYQRDFFKRTNETDPSMDDLRTFVAELSRTPDHELEAWLARRMDLDRLVRFLAASILVGNSGIDDSGSFLVHDRILDKWTWVPWDLNNARIVFSRGNGVGSTPRYTRPIPFYTLYDPMTIGVAEGKLARYGPPVHVPFTVLFQRVWDRPALRNRVLDEVELLLDTLFDPAAAFPVIDRLHAIIRPDLQRDPWVDRAVAADAPRYLKDWVTLRTRFLREQLPAERRRGEGGLVVSAVGPGFVEVYNRDATGRALSGLRLTNDLRDRLKGAFPSGAVVPPKGTLRVPLTVPAEGGEVGIFQAADQLPVDVAYVPALGGRTYARTDPEGEDWGWR